MRNEVSVKKWAHSKKVRIVINSEWLHYTEGSTELVIYLGILRNLYCKIIYKCLDLCLLDLLEAC